jgi:myosin-5
LKPHVYATSAAAYKGLQNFDRNQSILVSGESGAGKTETVKILMGHIAHISGKRNDDSHIEKVLSFLKHNFSKLMSVTHQVLRSNPLLESFGNAKTARNDNSSRFGKLISHAPVTGSYFILLSR